jgi:RNA polymerase sigma-70 factor (ECF subfamily)
MNTTPVSLLECLRSRPDKESWQRFADLYQPWLRGQLRRHTLQAADVDDLVQEVMTVLMKEVPNFQHSGRKGAFRTWLRGITVNRLRELWRQRKQVPAPGGSDFAERLDQLADDQSELSRLWDREHDQHVVRQLLKAVAADFEPKTWQAFRAFVMDGRKAADVAAEMGISEGAVWTAKSHVLKRLRQVANGLLD